MPLLKSHPANEPGPVVDTPTRKGTFFSRNHSVSPEPVQTANRPNNWGFFSRRRSSEDSSLGHNSVANDRLGRGNSVGSSDPTIVAARAKVTTAEKAEADADRALVQARAMSERPKIMSSFWRRRPPKRLNVLKRNKLRPISLARALRALVDMVHSDNPSTASIISQPHDQATSRVFRLTSQSLLPRVNAIGWVQTGFKH
ncbi:hypothetical protein B0H10DRAFT_754342 [Mycena sp. CBHHK59/15]|nr:hypothetical protein B0H10DRAFT_754342 [Mycena sp. CBHHK59/15]